MKILYTRKFSLGNRLKKVLCTMSQSHFPFLNVFMRWTMVGEVTEGNNMKHEH